MEEFLDSVGEKKPNRSALVSRNVWIGKRRTSIKLEPVFWDILERVCKREGMSIHEICTSVYERDSGYGLTGAIRVFLLTYAWTAGMEESLSVAPDGRLPERRSRAKA